MLIVDVMYRSIQQGALLSKERYTADDSFINRFYAGSKFD